MNGAADGLQHAVEGFESADMPLYATVCRRRLGALVAGERSLALRRVADNWMAAQEIRNADAMTRFFAPGFPD